MWDQQGGVGGAEGSVGPQLQGNEVLWGGSWERLCWSTEWGGEGSLGQAGRDEG